MAKKPNLAKAISIGKALAAQTLKRRSRALQKRRKALEAKGIKVAPAKKGAAGKQALAKAPVTHASAGVLIAEGDSWFDYPFYDVLSELEDGFGFDIESVAHRGDTIEDMAYTGGQLDEFSRLVEKVLRTGVRPRAILLSGGGNDVAGDEFAILLNHAASSIAGLNDSVVTGVIDERARDAYATILSAITAICTNHLGQPLPIVVHGYDYPVPDGRGYLGGFGPLPGPWLDPGFRRKGYAQMTQRKQICVALIDRFNAMLKSLAGKPPFAHVKFLDLRNTLAAGATYKNDWENELHPTERGYQKVAAKFAGAV
ncbi:SGNH/GDSL hydrolase family protein [Taklimakanibacter lacteus]|uniref:SGNH/GDSL hydrolase family protein n=1 Tax=Taklimakanibacter lacteus TaxID=2268456 RepID=UPI000E662F0E